MRSYVFQPMRNIGSDTETEHAPCELEQATLIAMFFLGSPDEEMEYVGDIDADEFRGFMSLHAPSS